MGKYIGIRLAHALVILAIVIVLVFVIARLIPGDAIMAAMAGSVDLHDPSVVTRVRHQYGLDEPILVQFAVWLKRFVRGDWGISIGTGENVLDMFLRRLPVTLELFVGAWLWSVAIGIPAGIIGALKRNSTADMIVTAGAIVGVSIPAFWEAIVLIYLLAVLVPVFPPSGYVPFSDNPLLNLRAMVLPTFVLGTHCGRIARALCALEPARGARARLHPDRAGQGLVRGGGDRKACAQAGNDPGGHCDRLVLGRAARRRLFRRGDLRDTWTWSDERRCHFFERLSCHAGDPDRGLAQRAVSQSSGRHPLRIPRSPCAGARMTEILPALPIASPASRSPAWALFRAVVRHRLASVGLAIIAMLCFIAIFASILAPYSPYDQDLYRVLAPPSAIHWLGTDNLGRDLFSRILYGARVSLFVGIVSSALSACDRHRHWPVRRLQGRQWSTRSSCGSPMHFSAFRHSSSFWRCQRRSVRACRT